VRKKKWLLIIVAIIFVINIVFFILVRLAKVDEIVQSKFSEYISQTMNAKVNIGHFSFNDRQLKVSQLSISSSGNYNLMIDQIYVEYNLPKLLFSNFKNLRAIKHIKIYEPVFQIKITPSGEKKENKEITIPDIAKFFKVLDIYNGKVEIEFVSGAVGFKHSWSDISLSIDNPIKSNIKFSAVDSKNSSLNASAVLHKGNVEKASLNLVDFFPDSLQLPFVKSLSGKLNVNAELNEKQLSYSVNLEKLRVIAFGRNAQADKIIFAGNKKSANINWQEFNIDDNEITGSAAIIDISNKKSSLSADLNLHDVSLSKYLNMLDGKASAEFKINGKLGSPKIHGQITSSRITAFSQEINDLQFSTEFKEKTATLTLDQVYWENNLITGSGVYDFKEGLNFDLHSKNLQWASNDLEINGDLESEINFKKKLNASLHLKNISVQNPQITLDDLSLTANMEGSDVVLYLERNGDISLTCNGNTKEKDLSARLQLKRFDLSSVLNSTSLPLLSGNLDLTANEFSIVSASNIRAYDQNFGKLDGRIKSNIVIDLTNKKTFLNIRTHNAKYNYEPFEINLLAEGSLDSIKTKQFRINNKINIDSWVKIKPSLECGLKISGNKIKLRDFSKYFTNYHTYSNISGYTSFDVNYDKSGDGYISGNFNIDKFRIGQMQEFNAELNLTGNNSSIKVENSKVTTGEFKIIDLSSDIILKPELVIHASGRTDLLDLKQVLPNNNVEGKVRCGLNLLKQENESTLSLDFSAGNLKVNRFKADSIHVFIVQEDSLLNINKFFLKRAGEIELTGFGAIGYNILKSTTFPDTNCVSFQFNGDFLKLLSHQTKIIESGSSRSNFDFRIGIKENGLSINSGNINISKGSLSIKNQLEKLDKIKIELSIIDNIFQMKKFRFKMGGGNLYIRNEIGNDNNDFKLGNLNLGHFLIKTNEKGILFHMPDFMPSNSVTKTIITGRNSDGLLVNGPFDDIRIIGDLHLSNGQVIFPPGTENLLQLFNKVIEVKMESEHSSMPFTLDMMLNFNENIRYVTFPIDVKLKPGGYLHLKYENGQFVLPEALFIAEEGSVDMFGTNLVLDYMQVLLSQFGGGANITGTFYKKTSDGTLITLEIFNDKSGVSSLGTLRFDLRSDNPNDRTTDILAKLRYNRTMNEISPAQKKTLLQDEVIQIAGLGLESAVLDPLISPVENWLRQAFRFDYFHLQTDLIQNLFASYSSENKSEYYYTEESNDVIRLTSEVFLNNLSVSMGKYVTRKLFVDYETRFEKPEEIITDTNMGIYHAFTLRYDLPLRLKISYSYNILPFDETNTHQIMLQRSFRF